MPEYLHPGVYVSEIPGGARPIEGVSTSTACFIGKCSMGRPFAPTLITNWEEFNRLFGGLDASTRAHMPLSVQQFFVNGGVRTYILRTIDPSAPTAQSRKPVVGNVSFRAKGPGDWGNVTVVMLQNDVFADRADFVVLARRDGLLTQVEFFGALGFSETGEKFFASQLNRDSNYVEAFIPPDADDYEGVSFSGIKFAKIKDGQFKDMMGVEVALEGGSDGDPKLALDGSAIDKALLSLERIVDISILAAPGVNEPTLVNKCTSYVSKTRAQKDMVFLVDPPGNAQNTASESDQLSGVKDYLGKINSSNSYSILYFPWVEVADPYSKVPGATRYAPPSGFMAGIYARTDNTRGVWKAPAGVEASLGGAVGLGVDISDADQDTLNPRGINCIRKFPGSGIVCWGARTLGTSSEPEYRYVPIRRFAIFLRRSLYGGTQWVVFEPNDEPLWAQVRFNLDAFMLRQFRSGALQGGSPKDAFFVLCDATNNIQATIDAGELHIRIGFAPLKPAEFVIIELQQIARES